MLSFVLMKRGRVRLLYTNRLLEGGAYNVSALIAQRYIKNINCVMKNDYVRRNLKTELSQSKDRSGEFIYLRAGVPPWSSGSVLDHSSLPPVFESQRGHI